MSSRAEHAISRRSALTGFVIAAACGSTTAGRVFSSRASENDLGPGFSPSGPNAEYYGEKEGFPVADHSLSVQPGEPYDIKYRVGAYSHFDEIYPTHRIKRAARPWMFKRSKADIRYSFRGNRSSVAEYLSRNPVTGLLIAKDDEILFEHYQYGRTDRDRFMSQSMAKSVTAMLVGIAIGQGAINSVDDPAEKYVLGFKGSEYGETSIRDLLHMSSGVEFGETKDGQRHLNRLWVDMVLGLGPTKGTINTIVQFNRRIAPSGTKYSYASIEADVVGVVLHYAVNRSLSDYLRENLWEPIGAEADAAWVIDAQGFEVAHGFFNAVPRLCAGRAPTRPRRPLGRQANHSSAVRDRRDDDTAVRHLPCSRQGHAGVRLWLFHLAASGTPTPVRARRCQRPAHLRRPSFEADYGANRCRDYR